jgi:phosphoglycolate phosphatase
MKKTILFDLDGTIIDPGMGIIKSYCSALDTLGHGDKITENMNWIIGPPLRKSFASILPPELIETAVAKYREIHAISGLNDAIIYDGIKETIFELKQNGFQLFVCTAKNVPFARTNIEYFGLSDFFDEIYGSHLDGTFDDKADLIAHIVETQNLDIKSTIMIGDREHDIIAALKNNIDAIGVLWGYGTRAELEKAGAKNIFEQVIDFKHFILQTI